MTTRMKPGQMVIAALRKMIASGELKTGERIAEIPTAAALGVSRMPVRTALRALEVEGLVTRLGARGYAAACPPPTQVQDAIEVRGVLEGLAAARLATRGVDAVTDAAFAALLATGDALFADGTLPDDGLERFGRYNLAFHDLLTDASGNAAIKAAITRNNQLPLASAGAFALDPKDIAWEFEHLRQAHHQHHDIVAHVRSGDAQAAEQAARDHARIAMLRHDTLPTATAAPRW